MSTPGPNESKSSKRMPVRRKMSVGLIEDEIIEEDAEFEREASEIVRGEMPPVMHKKQVS